MSINAQNRNCPYCQTPIKNESEAIVCSQCYTPHHPECWDENNGCTSFGCSNNKSSATGINVGDLTPQEAELLTVTTPASSTLINCTKCDGLIDENSVYCKFCGSKISTENDSSDFLDEFQNRYKQKVSFNRRRNFLAIFSTVVLVTVIVIATLITINKLETILTPEYPEQEFFLNNWLRTWESKDIKGMSEFMTVDYQYKGPDNKTSNKTQKLRRLEWTFENYKFIDIKVSDVIYSVDSTTALIEFNQEYESDKYSERGRKKLYLKLSDDNWKIYREEFR